MFVGNPTLMRFINKAPVETELSYVREVPRNDARIVTREPMNRSASKMTVEKAAPPPFIDKDGIFNKTRTLDSRQGLFLKPATGKPDVVAVRMKVVMPTLDLDKINNPTYLSYYQIVREKIRRAAYHNYSQADTGEVYLSFILSREGDVQEVLLNEDRSSRSTHLREVALQSIRDAQPFPHFPQDLDYERLSFNVVISFEVE